jgi:hypothetical protein
MRRLLFSFIALAILVVASIAGADVRSGLKTISVKDDDQSDKSALSYKGITIAGNRSYRSPGALRKVVIPSDAAEALARASGAGAYEIADYDSFKLFVTDQATIDDGGESSYIVRDDFNVLLLRSGAIDTSADAASGGFLGLGGASGSEMAARAASFKGKRGASELRLVQFVGPVKRAWLDQLRASGLELVAYVPNNGYLVRSDEAATNRLLMANRAAARQGESFIQWEGPFEDQYKVHPRIASRMNDQAGGEAVVAVQIARKPSGQTNSDVEAAKRLASSTIGEPYSVLNFINLKMRVELAKIGEIAALENVVNIEPWSPPQLFDERASQITAGELSDDGKAARGPGYLAWLASRGLTSPFGFLIDVADSGLDRGSTSADKLHQDFLDSNGQSRVTYARDYTSELDPGDTGGHGTINLSIAGGATAASTQGLRDSSGFNYGLGIAPFARLGSSKIFQSTGRFDLIEPYTKLISEAYRDGARVQSNSWGEVSNTYTLDSQEYDARVRDAAPAQPGNQEISICFAAGNAGPGRRITSPSTAKNVISVGASESARKDGEDGCGVPDTGADSAMDIAFFSGGGPLEDGRLKPDICAPGTHVQGAASQHPDFDGTGVCGEDIDKPYFPKGQTLYTWSSGTSHATPQIAGAAALARQFFLNRGEEPSAALIKAMLVNGATYMTGEFAGGNLPHVRQGWGRLNLTRTFDNASRVIINQSHSFTDSGQAFVITGEVRDLSQPFRVSLVWSDAPGLSAFAPWVNDLDLEVTINGQLYRGNNFAGDVSQPGGEANVRDNVEGVWLPAGTRGTFVIRIRATTVAGDGVPGNADFTDQDFALVVYNGERKDVAVATLAGVTVAGGGNAAVDPGETVTMKVNISNASPAASIIGRGTLTTATRGVAITSASADFPAIAPAGTGENATPFTFTVDQTVGCGSVIDFVLDVESQGAVSRLPFSVSVGNKQAVEFFTDDVESGQSKWTHGSLVKKKKNQIDTWTISTKRFRSGASAWFTPAMGKPTDVNLDTLPIQLPTDGRNLQLTFFHTFEFERGEFDGAVLEISSGGAFEDLGPKILQGGYNGTIFKTSSNPLSERAGWVEGRHGQLQPVVVDLSSFAGKTVVIRFRVGTDTNVKGLGWYIDDIALKGDRVSCSP